MIPQDVSKVIREKLLAAGNYITYNPFGQRLSLSLTSGKRTWVCTSKPYDGKIYYELFSCLKDVDGLDEIFQDEGQAELPSCIDASGIPTSTRCVETCKEGCCFFHFVGSRSPDVIVNKNEMRCYISFYKCRGKSVTSGAIFRDSKDAKKILGVIVQKEVTGHCLARDSQTRLELIISSHVSFQPLHPKGW